MNIRFHLLVTFMLYIFTMPVFAHPGPHSHVGVAEGAWHAFIGWELGLAGFVAASGAWFLIHRLRNTQAK